MRVVPIEEQFDIRWFTSELEHIFEPNTTRNVVRKMMIYCDSTAWSEFLDAEDPEFDDMRFVQII